MAGIIPVGSLGLDETAVGVHIQVLSGSSRAQVDRGIARNRQFNQQRHRPVPWRAVWPGAISATLAIGVVSFAFPVYLSSISTIARFGTTIVFVLIVLGWFYVLALIILGGGVLNALRLER